MRSIILKGAVLVVTLLCVTLFVSAGQRGRQQGQGSLDRGRAIYQNVCSACHSLDFKPATPPTREGWAKIIESMIALGAPLTSQDASAVLDYLAGPARSTGAATATGSSPVGTPVSPVQPFTQAPVGAFGQPATPITVPSAPRDNGSYSTAAEWRQWGGPGRNFISDATGIADSWPSSGPRVIWSRALGLGHSAIAFDDRMLFTLYRPGRETSRNGPWEQRERVIAIDAASGKTFWEFEYPSESLNFSYGAGPHAMPLVTQDIVFTAGTNKQIHALDKKTGRAVWTHDLVKEYGAPPTLIRPAVKAGYAASPIAYKDMVIVVAGGRGQSVMAFRQQDGSLKWKSGDFLTAESAPMLINVDGQTQLVVVGGQTVNGLDPDTGKILWSFPHDTEGDMNNTAPIWAPGNVLIVSSAYNQGTRALKLTRTNDTTRVEQAWFNSRFKLMFSNAIQLGDYIYGTHGDFGPAFLGAVNIKTGQTAWQQRGFGRSSLIWADGKAIIMDEDGVLKLAKVSPEGVTILATAPIFKTTSWTVPTLAGSTLYARDREKIVALDLGKN